MKTRTQLREILDDIEATIPEARERHADDEDEFFVEVRSMVQLTTLADLLDRLGLELVGETLAGHRSFDPQ